MSIDIKQLRYFVKIVEHGSMSRAATELATTTSALSQQMSRLEGVLATRLLLRRATGVQPTEAGLTLFQQAQLILRQLSNTTSMVQQGRLTGTVSVGLAPSSSSMMSVPFIDTMSERYPGIQLRIIEGLSNQLWSLLNTRQIDLAIIFDDHIARRWNAKPLLTFNEDLLLISAPGLAGQPKDPVISVSDITHLPLVVPVSDNTLRRLVFDAFRKHSREPRVAVEIDGLGTALDAVRAGFGATIQTGSAMAGLDITGLVFQRIQTPTLLRFCYLACLSDDELSPAALAARVVLTSITRKRVLGGQWYGTSLPE